jgi:REP element-mobilizing transposase RayT
MLERLREMSWQVGKKMDCMLIEMSGESDHVHLLVDFHPKNSISNPKMNQSFSYERFSDVEFSNLCAILP